MMSLINWSDPEEMLGLLSEYADDELSESTDDATRSRFLRALSAELHALASQASELSERHAIAQLRALRDSQPTEFCDDVVLTHLEDCIEELERISREAAAAQTSVAAETAPQPRSGRLGVHLLS